MTLLFNYWTLISCSVVIISAPYWRWMPNEEWIMVGAAWLFVSQKVSQLRWTRGCCIALVIILTHGAIAKLQMKSLFLSGSNITITGEVDSLFTQISHGFEGTLVLRSINGQNVTRFLRPKIQLISPVALSYGDVIHTKVTLKRIIGRLNQAGYDKEAHFFAEGLMARASLAKDARFRIEHFSSLKRYLITTVADHTKSLPSQPLILALSFGLKSDISHQTWQQLKASGLSHLLAISGLHIGIAFGVGWALGSLLLRCSPRCHFLPILFAISLAYFYAWLAGLTLPTQRALVMCLLLSVLMFFRWRLAIGFKWLVTLVVVLALNPFSTLSAGFWLSFSAVAAIFLFLNQDKRTVTRNWARHRLGALVKLQLWLTLFMLPLSVMWFQGMSLLSPVYNLIFVGLFSLIIVPGILLSVLLSAVTGSNHVIWQVLDTLLNVVVTAIGYADIGWVRVSPHVFGIVAVLLVLVLVWRLLSVRLRLWGIAAAFGVSLTLTGERNPPNWRVDILDVGHGLAIIIEQQGSAYVYDTGNAWLTGSFAQDVIMPILRQRGISQLEGFIVSHLDADHAAGKSDVERFFAPKLKLASQKLPGYQECVQGRTWRWKALTFEILWPQRLVDRAYNAHSCVIRISDGMHSVLIPGDVSAIAEWLIVRQSNLKSDVVIVPHHGSRTSSTIGFVRGVSAELAVASLEKDGRWSLPAQEVVKRYHQQGTKWLDTGESGQISLDFYSNYWKANQLRAIQGQVWYRQMLRNGVE